MEPRAAYCQTCTRPASGRLPFNCPTCARNQLYEPRIHHAQVLLEKERLGREVERAVKSSQDGGAAQGSEFLKEASSSNSLRLEDIRSEHSVLAVRSEEILTHVDVLREEAKHLRLVIAKRKARNIQRRKDIISAKKRLAEQEAEDLEPLEKSMKKINVRWDSIHDETVEARLFMCQETARLYGLQQRRRKKGRSSRENYSIGGVPITDLRDLNSTFPFSLRSLTSKLTMYRRNTKSDYGFNPSSCQSSPTDISLSIPSSAGGNRSPPSGKPLSNNFQSSIILQWSFEHPF